MEHKSILLSFIIYISYCSYGLSGTCNLLKVSFKLLPPKFFLLPGFILSSVSPFFLAGLQLIINNGYIIIT